MKARITFRSEVYVEGKDINEIKNKWEDMPVFSADALEEYGADLVEMVSVEDADTYDEIDLYGDDDDEYDDEFLADDLIDKGYNVARTALGTLVTYEVFDNENGCHVKVYIVEEGEGEEDTAMCNFLEVEGFDISKDECDCDDPDSIFDFSISKIKSITDY